MKKRLGIFSALIAGLASCVKIETVNDIDSYNTIIEYAVNSKKLTDSILLGPIEVSPSTWVDTDADCYVQIDNDRVLILNQFAPHEDQKGKLKMLALHYDSKSNILKDFKKFLEIPGIGYSGSISLSAVAGEVAGTNFEKRLKIDLANVLVDYDKDNNGRGFYFVIFNYNNIDGNTESSYIIIPEEFVS